jgi:hypothetical protein
MKNRLKKAMKIFQWHSREVAFASLTPHRHPARVDPLQHVEVVDILN